MELYKFTINELLIQPDKDQYFTVGHNLTPKKIISTTKDLDDQEFGLVKELQQALRVSEYEKILPLASKYSGVEEDEMLKLVWFDFFHQWNYIIEDIKRSLDREDKFLSYHPTGNELEAGIENLYKFGAFATIDRLADGKVWDYKKVEQTPYGIIFTKLLLDSETNEFQREYQRITSRR
jgi:hypothetical protein